jgi:hypothetical protein
MPPAIERTEEASVICSEIHTNGNPNVPVTVFGFLNMLYLKRLPP